MRVLRITAITIFSVVAVSLGVNTTVVRAADPIESITLTPTSKTYKVDPGQTLEDTITVLNDGETAYDFTVYTAPYSVASGSYDPSFTSTASNADAYTWIQFKQTTWHVESRQSVKVPYVVHVKANASPGGHYGVIFAEVQPSDTSSGSTLARKKRVGSIIYATVSGDVRLAGASKGTSIGWFQSSAPVKITTSVENTGNSDFNTSVVYQVSDIFGSVKYSLQSEYTVLPYTTRDMTLNWEEAPWFGLYKARVTTSFLDQKNITESYVLVMPIWMLLLVGAVVVSGGIYAIWRWSNRANK